MNLTPTDHRLLQVLLHLSPVTPDILALVIANGRKLRRGHPAKWLNHLRRKLESGVTVRLTRLGYVLKRQRPLRDRAAYMKDYRLRVGRPSRAKAHV